MAKDLIDECTLPAPLAAFSTGNAKADAAIAKLVVWEISAYDPNNRPYGKDYAAVCKTAASVGAKRLVPLLGETSLFEVGHAAYDEARVGRMSPSKKKAYQKVYDAAIHARKARTGFIDWLIETVIPDGYEEILAIGANTKLPLDVRNTALAYLAVNFTDKKKLREIAAVFDFRKWNGKDATYEELAVTCIEALNAADKKAAFESLKDLVTKKAEKKNPGLADAVITALYRGEPKDFDPRWAKTIAPLAIGPNDVITWMALEKLAPDPSIIPPILESIGDLAKLDYVNDMLVSVISRVATLETVPFFQRALEVNPEDREKYISALKAAKRKDVVKALEAAPPPAAATKGEQGRERPTLVYKKTKPLKATKLLSLAKQEADWKKLFAAAGIPGAWDKVARRAVVMIPKRVEESTIAIGATKLGGHPDLPANVDWPRVAKEPLTFLAQLRLEDFAPLLPKGALPAKGTLAFFVDNDARSTKGEYLSNARAILSKPGARLERREVPDDFVDKIYFACAVKLREKWSLPSPSNAHATKNLDEETLETYTNDVSISGPAYPQILGYRDHGYDAEEPATAQMLLQLTGDAQSDMEFGDCDYLSFFIDAKKLAKGDFGKIWPHVGD